MTAAKHGGDSSGSQKLPRKHRRKHKDSEAQGPSVHTDSEENNAVSGEAGLIGEEVTGAFHLPDPRSSAARRFLNPDAAAKPLKKSKEAFSTAYNVHIGSSTNEPGRGRASRLGLPRRRGTRTGYVGISQHRGSPGNQVETDGQLFDTTSGLGPRGTAAPHTQHMDEPQKYQDVRRDEATSAHPQHRVEAPHSISWERYHSGLPPWRRYIPVALAREMARNELRTAEEAVDTGPPTKESTFRRVAGDSCESQAQVTKFPGNIWATTATSQGEGSGAAGPPPRMPNSLSNSISPSMVAMSSTAASSTDSFVLVEPYSSLLSREEMGGFVNFNKRETFGTGSGIFRGGTGHQGTRDRGNRLSFGPVCEDEVSGIRELMVRKAKEQGAVEEESRRDRTQGRRQQGESVSNGGEQRGGEQNLQT